MTRALLGLVVVVATAGEIPASWMNAIPDHVDEVTGIDVDRLRATGSHGASLVDIPFDAHRSIRYAMRIGPELYLLKINGDPFALAPHGRRFIAEGREVLDAGDGKFLTRALRETAIVGGLHQILWTAQLLECCPKHNSTVATWSPSTTPGSTNPAKPVSPASIFYSMPRASRRPCTTSAPASASAIPCKFA